MNFWTVILMEILMVFVLSIMDFFTQEPSEYFGVPSNNCRASSNFDWRKIVPLSSREGSILVSCLWLWEVWSYSTRTSRESPLMAGPANIVRWNIYLPRDLFCGRTQLSLLQKLKNGNNPNASYWLFLYDNYLNITVQAVIAANI